MRIDQRRMLQQLGASITARQFTPAAEGWVFQDPALWVFGPRPHYRVSETDKARIETLVGVSMLVSLLVPFALLVVFWEPLTSSALWRFLLVASLLMFAAGLIQSIALRLMLRDLPHTFVRRTLDERFQLLTHHSAWYLTAMFVGSVCSVLLCLLLATYSIVTKGTGGELFIWSGIFAAIALFFRALLRAKLRGHRTGGTRVGS